MLRSFTLSCTLPRFVYLLVVLSLLIAVVVPVGAQDSPPESPPEPVRVEITASDDWTLVGNFYAAPEDAQDETGAPVVVLLHQANSRKEAFYEVAPALQTAGYAALAIDQRGGGETRGSMTIENSVTDVLEWIAWLREQPGVDPDRVNVLGGSMGANISLLVMARDEGVVTAVAMSPGTSQGYGVWDLEGVFDDIGDRPVWLIASQRDEPSGPDTEVLFTQSTGNIQLRMMPRGSHGTGMFMIFPDLLPSIIGWLDAYNR
ncbi:MAG: alpha/beta hydrolase [Chloroflexi bacterium]|nr:alpha/beta hydrolase [Chloroflexota bacterium]